MQADEFARELAKAAPTVSDLEACGLSIDEANKAISRRICEKRARPLTPVFGHDAMLELLRNWDLSDVAIGQVRFPGPPVERRGKIRIGSVEADELIMLPETGEIVVHEFGVPDHLLWRVAQDGSKLLDALIIAARFLTKTGVGEIPFDDPDVAAPVAAECAAAAGGDRYRDFYNMLLGADA